VGDVTGLLGGRRATGRGCRLAQSPSPDPSAVFEGARATWHRPPHCLFSQRPIGSSVRARHTLADGDEGSGIENALLA